MFDLLFVKWFWQEHTKVNNSLLYQIMQQRHNPVPHQWQFCQKRSLSEREESVQIVITKTTPKSSNAFPAIISKNSPNGVIYGYLTREHLWVGKCLHLGSIWYSKREHNIKMELGSIFLLKMWTFMSKYSVFTIRCIVDWNFKHF